jgi:hypothetical protein
MSLASGARCSVERLGGALGAPAFASGSLPGPGHVCITRLATVVVHVDHPRIMRELPGDLVHVPRRGDARPDIQEPHRPLEKCAVSPGDRARLGEIAQDPPDSLPINRVIILAAR